MTWNRVVTIEDYFDHPLEGVAFRSGKLVAYKILWDDEADDYSKYYAVSPISEALLPLIEEKWATWVRWSDAFDAGEVTIDTHPVLPEDREQHESLTKRLEGLVQVDDSNFERLRAQFRTVQTRWTGIEVRWLEPCVD